MIDTLFPFGWGHYLAGGLFIGASVALLFLLTGLIGGMSSVFSSTWSWFSRQAYFQQPRYLGSRVWRLVFAAGLIGGGALWWFFFGPAGGVATQVPPMQLFWGGLLVGFGARLSGGCTSGHGICGLASLQLPSALAVLVFMATAFATANLVLALGGR